MAPSSPLLRALMSARPDVPDELVRFDAEVRAGARGPSFEEYSARVGEALMAWRQTCYFDLDGPAVAAVAHGRLLAVAADLGFALPGRFVALVQAGMTAGPEVLQIVLGYDAGDALAPARLKYYLVFRAAAEATVEQVRAAVDGPPLPPTLVPSTIDILGLDFSRAGLHDFKVYVRLDPRRVGAAIRNLGEFAALQGGCRYLVFQRCLLTAKGAEAGQQVYFHAGAAGVVEAELGRRAAREPAAAALQAQVMRMNAALPLHRWRPWIASYPFAGGLLRRSPSNLYFHLEEGARGSLDGRGSQGRTGRG